MKPSLMLNGITSLIALTMHFTGKGRNSDISREPASVDLPSLGVLPTLTAANWQG
jgi:hypothetical protein